FNAPPPPELYPLSLHDALPIFDGRQLDHELILVDDGSADGTRRVMEAAAKQHSSVRIEVLPHNRGKGRALAVGVEAAKGDEILRSEEHTSELQSRFDLVCRLLL